MCKQLKLRDFTTSDGVTLRYLEVGRGPILLMLHGWSQGAVLFKYQLSGLSGHFRVIALDMRGHGQSDKPSHGHRLSRLAKDLQELVTNLQPGRIHLLGHSAGCSVIWSYLEMFGGRNVDKLIFIDEPACLLADPSWPETERLAAGGIFTPDALYRFVDNLVGPKGTDATREILLSMVTPAMSAPQREELVAVNLQCPRLWAAKLFVDNVTQDWRDFIPTIKKPTLLVFGRASPHPLECQQWIHRQINGSRLEVFEAEEGGSHFLFLEAPAKLNTLIDEFLNEFSTTKAPPLA
ncbi:alpha/beta hydrolase [Microbulbifer sp. OS29]|uniref:Alpha/beta hydrolase n=1 Tax=Microbulbifer okhotskensis TaxID=2926617 RepID=A0A9X2EUN8_9GAMM|nr:alpha/beta hydrolase [Microbulbifer okhotskensis]MCO1335838.1 alpha/beta hydrolase [Microbulbifer okhotskensis]